MAKKYEITNYGNTRTVYVKGQSWELPKNGTIETTDKEVANECEKLQFVDVKAVEQPKRKKSSKKKKKVAAGKKRKKIKQRKK